MFDNIKIKIDNLTLRDDIFQVADVLYDVKETNSRRGYFVRGRCGSMPVKISLSGIVISGSLSKYLNDTNILPLSRKTTAEAVEKLSDELHCKVNDGRVTYLEMASDNILSHKIASYTSMLGDCGRLKRRMQGDSVYYKNSNKQQQQQIVFYDKVAEMMKRGEKPPDIYVGENVLRYELRLRNRLPQQLRVPEVKASTLSNQEFYQKAKGIYLDKYHSIKKIKQISVDDMGSELNTSEAKKFFFAMLLQDNPEKVKAYLDGANFKNRKEASRFRADIKRLQNISLADNNPLIAELNNSIRNMMSY